MELATILAFIQAGLAAAPEGLALIQEVKALFGETDQAVIDKALAVSGAAADAQHAAAQAL